ncbi:MAG: class A beta-lactamase-related serine hydrolase [Bacteroidetes bacterium]|nr:class A beta-lactamase-related serine hydrolase [Bacteroidota bacterium]
MKRILLRKIPFYFLLIAGGLLWLIIYQFTDITPTVKQEIQQAQATPINSQEIQQVRLQDYQLIKPLIMTEVMTESGGLKELNRALSFEINTLKSTGAIIDASVYVRRLNDGEWTSVNGNETYAPGSIIKVAGMITYLKMCEQNPQLLNKEYFFQGRRKGVPNQTFNDDPMVAGKKYSAKELLTRVIVNSDNDATLIMNESLDINLFKKLFTDLGIPEPDVHDPNFTINTTDLSKFLRVLFNATYLNKENSIYALTLLSKSSFTKGIVGGLPANTLVAHKFGETGNGVEAQLHETAIVYLSNEPYLITIMTKGKNVQRLPEVLSDLSKIAYQSMNKVEVTIR